MFETCQVMRLLSNQNNVLLARHNNQKLFSFSFSAEHGIHFVVMLYALSVPTLVICVISCCCCLLCYFQRRQDRRRRQQPSQQFHSYPSQQPGCNTSHLQVPGAVFAPDTRERQPTTANPLEVLMVRLPPLHSREQPSLPYYGEQGPPPYPREEPPPPYSEEKPLPSYALTSLV